MQVKTLQLSEVKEKYKDRHGFIFQGATRCDRRKCELVAEAVKQQGYSSCLPEVVIELNDRTFCFVYPENSSFESGAFYKDASRASQMLGLFQIDILSAFLKEN